MIEIDYPAVGFVVVGFGRLDRSSGAELAVDDIAEDLDDECRLSGTGHPGDRGVHAEGQVHVEVFQIMEADPAQPQLPGRRTWLSTRRPGTVEKGSDE